MEDRLNGMNDKHKKVNHLLVEIPFAITSRNSSGHKRVIPGRYTIRKEFFRKIVTVKR
jgi:hypothetical protein